MDIFQSPFYRINVILLSWIGQWPYQKHKKLQLFQQIICQFFIITVMMSQGIKLLEIWGDLDIMIECLTPMGVQFGACVKAISAIFHRKKLLKLLKTMERDWVGLRNEYESEMLKRYATEGRVLTIIYAVCLYSSLVIYLLIPLIPRFIDVEVPLNETQTHVYLYQTQYYVDPEEYFIWICLHTYSGTIITVTTIIASDTMFFTYVLHVCGILAIVGNRMKNLTPKQADTDCMSKDADDRCHKEIAICIDYHYEITDFANTIESSYSTSYLITLVIAMVLLSISAVQLLIKFGEIGEMIRLFLFNICQFNHLLFNSWPCQRLIDESVNFRDSVYASEWYSLSEENKHLLRFVLLRTLEPLQITAGKFYILSMENFGVVIQSSMSYFTVFASVR